MPEQEEPQEHHHTDFAKCPYCGYEDKDSWELGPVDGGEFDGETTCGSCDKDYLVSRYVSVSYSSKPVRP